jgi:hypothetical protein
VLFKHAEAYIGRIMVLSLAFLLALPLVDRWKVSPPDNQREK